MYIYLLLFRLDKKEKTFFGLGTLSANFGDWAIF